MNSRTAQLTENGTEIVRLFARFALGASFLSAVADRFGLWGGHMEQKTYPGEISLISWSTRARSRLYSPVHRQCRLRGQLPSRRHSLGFCLLQASKYEWPPSCPVFSFCHLL